MGTSAPSSFGRPESVTASSLLMQDTVSATGVSVGGGPSPLALFANPLRGGHEELLAVTPAGRLTHVRRTDTSTTGWEQVEVPGLPTVTEVVVAVHPDSGVWAAAVTGSASLLLLRHGADDGWTIVDQQFPLPGNWSRLRVAYEPGSPPVPIIYGADPGGRVLRFVHALVPVPGTHAEDWLGMSTGQLAGALDSFALARRSGGSPYDYVTARYGVANTDQLRVDSLTLTYNGLGLDAGVWSTTATGRATVVGSLPHPAGTGWIMLQDEGSVEVNWPTAMAPMTGSVTLPLAFSTVTAWTDAAGLTHLYGIDATSTLRVLHQTGWIEIPSNTGGVVPTWTRTTPATGEGVPIAVPMASGVARVVVDPVPDAGPSLLVQRTGSSDADRFVLYRQDPVSQQWSVETVAVAPGATPTIGLTDRYVTEVTVRDGYGRPMPGQPVQLSTDALTEAHAGGLTHLVGPSNPVELTTNPFGTLTVSIPARGLTCPRLTINTAGSDAVVSAQPASGLQNFLAGSGTLLPHPDPLTGTQLQDATVDGAPLVPSWDGMPSPDEAAASLAHLFATAAGTGAERGIVGFAVQTWDASRPSYLEFTDPGELAEHRTRLTAHPGYGGFWDDAAAWLNDVWESIRSVATAVWDIAVDIVGGLADIALEIGGAIVRITVSVATGDLDGAAHVAEALFQQLKARVDRAVGWLSALLDLGDIWDTQQAVEALLRQAPALARSVVDELAGRIDAPGWFERQQQHVTELAGWLRSAAGSQSGATIAATATTQVFHRDAGSPARSADDLTNPQANWLLDQVAAAVAAAPAGGVDAVPSAQAASAWATFLEAWDASGAATDFTRALEGAGKAITDLLDVDNPRSLMLTQVDNLATVLEGLGVGFLKLCDAIYQAVVAVIHGILADLETFLSTPLELGFLNEVYAWIQRTAHPDRDPEPMTVAGLAALVLAFPITIVHKVIMGVANPPFPGGKLFAKPAPPAGDEARDGATLSWATIWGSAAAFYLMFDLTQDLAGDSDPGNPLLPRLAALTNAALVVITTPAFGVDEDNNISVTVPSGDAAVAWIQFAGSGLIAAFNIYTAFTSRRMLRNLPRGTGIWINSGLGVFTLAYAVATSYHSTEAPMLWRVGNSLSTVGAATEFLRYPFFSGNKTPPAAIAWYGKATSVNVVSDAIGPLLCMLGYFLDQRRRDEPAS